MGSLGGVSNSTPPKGLNSSCIAVPRFLVGAASSSRAARRMSRASCSIERPFSAARIRSRRFRPSSRLRTVMLAKIAPPVSVVSKLYHDCIAIVFRKQLQIQSEHGVHAIRP